MTRPRPAPRPPAPRPRGGVAIIVAVSMAVLIGMAGLAIDAGRLYVNNAELQSAADTCALAAANELVCQAGAGVACPRDYLVNGERAGITAAAAMRRDLQTTAVVIAPADVRFSTTLGPNSGYQTSGVAPVDSRFAMCIARSNGIVPWLMGVVGAGAANNVAATAVATLAPSQEICTNAPIGVCSTGAAPNFGYTLGQWIQGNFTSNGNNDDVAGGFKWVDYTPNAGGNSEIRDQLAGGSGVCGINAGDNVNQPGTQQGAKLAYNTRFGIYRNNSGYTPANAPPDRTGYAWPNRNPGSPVIGVGTSAYNNYIARQLANAPFINGEYAGTGTIGGQGNTTVATSAQLRASGTDRRLIAVPVINCAGGNSVPVLGFACVLMLNPMSNGANGTIYLEYRGSATDPSSPCRSGGQPGGPGGTGPLVPTLAQ